MAQIPLTARRWTRAEYDRLVELGVFDGEPLELIGGQLIVAEPQGSYHASVINIVADVIRAALPVGLAVRVQTPIALDDDSEPEPDVSVVPGTHADYFSAHPQRPILLVEVADSSLRFDRREKESLYARGGIRDYWIVNLVDRVLEVYLPCPTPLRSTGGTTGRSGDSHHQPPWGSSPSRPFVLPSPFCCPSTACSARSSPGRSTSIPGRRNRSSVQAWVWPMSSACDP